MKWKIGIFIIYIYPHRISALHVLAGYASSLNIGETSGQYRYSLGGDIVTKDYDINDLGINFQTNYYSLYGNANYRILNSTKHLNSFNVNLNSFLQFQKETGKVQGNNFNINVNINNKKPIS